MDNSFNFEERKEILGMEFIKMGDKYLLKDSNGIVVDEEEKLKLENNEMVLKDFSSNKCQEETTKKISKNKKEIEKIENIKKTKSIKD